MRKEVSIKEAEKLNLSNYDKTVMQAAQKLADETSLYFPADPIILVSVEDGKSYYERTEIKLFHPVLDLRIERNEYRKKYDIYCRTMSTFLNVGNSYQYVADIEKPNEIGVLSAKKIQAWVSYYEQVCKIVVEADKQGAERVAAFLKSIKGLPVKWREGKTSGDILRNGIEFSFSINNGHVSTSMRLYHVDENVKTFLLMSDNKLAN